jgi:hypothetical protein
MSKPTLLEDALSSAWLASHGEIQGVDALEIFGVEHVLRAGLQALGRPGEAPRPKWSRTSLKAMAGRPAA